MKTEFKDVAHLYLGCQCNHKVVMTNGQVEDRGTMTFDVSLLRIKLSGDEDYQTTPILRQLSDMTEEESKSICRHTRDAKRTVIFSTAVGKESLQPDAFNFLLSKGFDLFGLIESGQALDATTSKK